MLLCILSEILALWLCYVLAMTLWGVVCGTGNGVKRSFKKVFRIPVKEDPEPLVYDWEWDEICERK